MRRVLTEPNTQQLREILGAAPVIFIDEAQRIPGIGLTSKIITDQFKEKQLILSGSSAFELSGNMNEPLTGRKWTFELYPVSWQDAAIGSLQPLAIRQNIGALWENFLISERIKQLSYQKLRYPYYFWRTTQQQEVDYVEERNGKIYGFEFKWNPKRKIRFSKTFENTYQAEVKGITRENFREFVIITNY